jgi:hypothetical protein
MIREWSGDYCSGITIVSIKGETGCGETINTSESEGPLGEPQASDIPAVVGHK